MQSRARRTSSHSYAMNGLKSVANTSERVSSHNLFDNCSFCCCCFLKIIIILIIIHEAYWKKKKRRPRPDDVLAGLELYCSHRRSTLVLYCSYKFGSDMQRL